MPASICRPAGISPEDDLHPPHANLIACDGENWAKFRLFCAPSQGGLMRPRAFDKDFRVAFR
jgi:hypothetical protein